MSYSHLHTHPLKEKKDRFWICSVCKANHLVRSTRFSCKQCTYHQCRKCFEDNKITEQERNVRVLPAPVIPAVEKKKKIIEAIEEEKKRLGGWTRDVVNPEILDVIGDSGDSVRLLINHKGKKFYLPELIPTSYTIKQLKIKINQLLKIPVVTLHRRDTEFGDEKYLYQCDIADDDELIVNKGLIREPKPDDCPYRQESGSCIINQKVPYHSLLELQEDLQKCGLESSNLILAIDYTKSNFVQGKYTFMGQNLHSLNAVGKDHRHTNNPYQTVMLLLAKTLNHFDDDNLIPCFGFGDITTTDKSVFPFWPNDKVSVGIEEVIMRYNEITPQVILSGPTSFGPIIRKAIQIVQNTKQYHILIIIADGEVQRVKDTADAIINASNYPISIIIVGVGDGPFDQLEEFDNRLTTRKFDNLNFVNFHEVTSKAGNIEDLEATFVIKALEEIPNQFRAILKLGLLDL